MVASRGSALSVRAANVLRDVGVVDFHPRNAYRHLKLAAAMQIEAWGKSTDGIGPREVRWFLRTRRQCGAITVREIFAWLGKNVDQATPQHVCQCRVCGRAL